MAALIACVIAVLVFMNIGGDPRAELLAQYMRHHPADGAVRAELPDETSTMAREQAISKALGVYEVQDYPKAIGLFNTLLAKEPTNDTLLFFAGLSQLFAENPRPAVEHLLSVIEQAGSSYDSLARWYIALAYLQMGNDEEARRYLRQVVAKTGFYKNKAMAILQELESL